MISQGQPFVEEIFRKYTPKDKVKQHEKNIFHYKNYSPNMYNAYFSDKHFHIFGLKSFYPVEIKF